MVSIAQLHQLTGLVVLDQGSEAGVLAIGDAVFRVDPNGTLKTVPQRDALEAMRRESERRDGTLVRSVVKAHVESIASSLSSPPPTAEQAASWAMVSLIEAISFSRELALGSSAQTCLELTYAYDYYTNRGQGLGMSVWPQEGESTEAYRLRVTDEMVKFAHRCERIVLAGLGVIPRDAAPIPAHVGNRPMLGVKLGLDPQHAQTIRSHQVNMEEKCAELAANATTECGPDPLPQLRDIAVGAAGVLLMFGPHVDKETAGLAAQIHTLILAIARSCVTSVEARGELPARVADLATLVARMKASIETGISAAST